MVNFYTVVSVMHKNVWIKDKTNMIGYIMHIEHTFVYYIIIYEQCLCSAYNLEDKETLVIIAIADQWLDLISERIVISISVQNENDTGWQVLKHISS